MLPTGTGTQVPLTISSTTCSSGVSTQWSYPNHSHVHTISGSPHNHGIYVNTNVQTSTANADLAIKGDKVFIDLPSGERLNVVALLRLVGELAERMKVLQPLLEKHEEYPALASAYDQYKVVERLVRSVEQDTPE